MKIHRIIAISLLAALAIDSYAIERGTEKGEDEKVAAINYINILTDREREIIAFNPEEYWTITAIFPEYEAELFKYKSDDIELKCKEDADKVLSEISNTYTVESVEKKEKNKKSKLPFTTSTLQQEASKKLNFRSARTMKVAQELYEGVDVPGMGATGLITYMRTDSVRISDDAQEMAKDFILNKYNWDKVTEKTLELYGG